MVLEYDSRIVDFTDRTKASVIKLSVQTIIAKDNIIRANEKRSMDKTIKISYRQQPSGQGVMGVRRKGYLRSNLLSAWGIWPALYKKLCGTLF